MTFAEYWDTDEAFAYRHADERTQAEAAWDAAMEAAAAKCDDLAETFGAPCRSCATEVRALKTPHSTGPAPK